MKKSCLLICLSLCACHSVTRHECRFEMIDDMFLCIDNQFLEEYNPFTEEYTQKNDDVSDKIIMDSYDCCITQLPYPVNLIEKEKDGVKVCYDKNNKIELPILYCQKDHNVNVDVNVSQTSIMKNTTFF